MTRTEAIILRAAAGWTLFVWLTRIKNIFDDPSRSFGFKAVHTALAVVSIIFAGATLWVTSKNRKREKSPV